MLNVAGPGANFAASCLTIAANDGVEGCVRGARLVLAGEALALREGVNDFVGEWGDGGAAGARPTPLTPAQLGRGRLHAWQATLNE